jgi:hypothetical protein
MTGASGLAPPYDRRAPTVPVERYMKGEFLASVDPDVHAAVED